MTHIPFRRPALPHLAGRLALALGLAVPAFSALPALAELQTFSAAGGRPAVAFALPFGVEDQEQDEIDGIAVDNSGNVAIGGILRDRLAVGDQMWTAAGTGDAFVISYDAGGNIRWARQLQGPGDDNVYDLQMDGAGNIYISGWFAGQIDMGGKVLTSNGSQDMFVAKYSSSGKLVWAHNFGGPSGDGGNELSVTSDGEIAISLESEGNFTLDGQTWNGGGRRDVFVLRLDTDGNLRWIVPFAGPGTERIRGVAMNENKQVFVGFQYQDSVSLGGTTLRSQGGWDGAVAAISANGEGRWIVPVGGSGLDNVRGLATGPGGSIYAAGVYQGPANMAGVEVPAVGKKGDDFLMRLSAEGTPEWLVTVGGKGTGTGPEIRSDDKGIIISSVAEGPVTIRRNREVLAELSPQGGGRATSYIAGFTSRGDLRFAYTPQALKGSGAMGDVLGVSPNNQWLAQALRFRGTINVDGRSMTTPAPKADSATILFRLNGG